jgi:cell wall integrity and stress response component
MLVHLPSGSCWPTAMFYTVLYLFLASQVHGLAISYCSPQNNAGSYPACKSCSGHILKSPILTSSVDWYAYQSNGECQNHCQGTYAFAVLQGNDCWCSNYIPSDQISTYDCNQACPGYPDEWCGSTDAGLYGYYLLSPNEPLGTSSGAVASATTKSSSPSVSTSLSEFASLIFRATVIWTRLSLCHPQQ